MSVHHNPQPPLYQLEPVLGQVEWQFIIRGIWLHPPLAVDSLCAYNHLMDTALEILIRPYQPADRQACRSLWAELTQQHRDLYHDGVYPQWSFLEIR